MQLFVKYTANDKAWMVAEKNVFGEFLNIQQKQTEITGFK